MCKQEIQRCQKQSNIKMMSKKMRRIKQCVFNTHDKKSKM